MQKDLNIKEFEDIFQPCSLEEIKKRQKTCPYIFLNSIIITTPGIPSSFFSQMLNQRQTSAHEVRMRMLDNVSREPKINVCGMWSSINTV